MQGYFNNDQATAEALDAQGWLHTGDVGSLDAEGNLRITGRLKDMFIVGGFNCYPAEIEAALSEHPSIAQVAVLGVPDERMGEVGCACVVLAPRRAGERYRSHQLVPRAHGQLQGSAPYSLLPGAANQCFQQSRQVVAGPSTGRLRRLFALPHAPVRQRFFPNWRGLLPFEVSVFLPRFRYFSGVLLSG